MRLKFVFNIINLVTRVQFAPNDRSLMATCGRDGIVAICQVLPTPATIIYRLKGHTAAINGSNFNLIGFFLKNGNLCSQ